MCRVWLTEDYEEEAVVIFYYARARTDWVGRICHLLNLMLIYIYKDAVAHYVS